MIENRKGFVKDSEFNQLGAGPAVTWLLHALAAVLVWPASKKHFESSEKKRKKRKRRKKKGERGRKRKWKPAGPDSSPQFQIVLQDFG